MIEEKESKSTLLSAMILRDTQKKMAIHCVKKGIKIKHFVEEALVEKLKKEKE